VSLRKPLRRRRSPASMSTHIEMYEDADEDTCKYEEIEEKAQAWHMPPPYSACFSEAFRVEVQLLEPPLHTSAYVSIRQHTSAYVSIRQR
jgi:hypothetical protein